MVVVRRLLVQRGLHPSGPGKLQHWPRQEAADRVFGELPVDPVVVIAVRSKERRREVETPSPSTTSGESNDSPTGAWAWLVKCSHVRSKSARRSSPCALAPSSGRTRCALL